MKIDTQILENQQARLKVEFDADLMNDAKQRAARKIARQTKIPGFRPGKAPYGVVVRTVGEAAIVEEALEILIDNQYPKIIEESKLHPYGPGQLENVVSFDPPIMEFLVPLEAEVTLGDYKAIRIPYELSAVSEDDVDQVIADLRERKAILEPVERPAQVGDQVFIRLSGERLDPPEGESPLLVTDRPMPVIIGGANDSSPAGEWPFPGFSLALIDMASGEEKTITHTFADDSAYTSLQGKTAQFSITVEEVKARTLPELDDAFAQSVGEYDSFSALRDEIRNSLETERNEDTVSEYHDEIAKKLFEIATWKYPPQMLEHEIEIFQDQLENRLSQQNIDMETYLKIRKLDEAGLKEEITPLAEERMKRTLVLMEIARLEDIKVSEEELQAESMRTLDQLSHMMPADKVRKTLTDEFIHGMIGNIGADLLVKRTWEYLHTVASNTAQAETVSAATEETPKKKRTKKKADES